MDHHRQDPPSWRRRRAAHVRASPRWYGDRLEVVDGRLALIRSDVLAQQGLGELDRIDAVVVVFNGHRLSWPVSGATRAEYVLRARSILRGSDS